MMSPRTTNNVDRTGVCPNCGTQAPLGQPCGEKVCARRGYHSIPKDRAKKQLARDTRLMDPLVGCLIGDYVIVDTIGAGGFGRVYLGFQMPIRRRPLKVALKVIDFGDDASQDTIAAMLGKFEAEADALASLSHPNIVRLMKYGQHESYPYIVMEFVSHGRTLYAELLGRIQAREQLLLEDSAHIMRQVVNGMEEAHDQDIIHRDIKPDNIMLQQVAGDPYFVRLLDFGLAKFVDERSHTSMTVGTPMYMAPEQLDKSTVGPWTDIYAMGVMAFELFTGRRAFQGDFQDIYSQKLSHDYDPLWRAADIPIPDVMTQFLRTAMAINPDERFQSCSQFRAAMEKALSGQHQAGLQTVEIAYLVDEELRPNTDGRAPAGAATATQERPELGSQNTVQAPPSDRANPASSRRPLLAGTPPPMSSDTMRPGHDQVAAPPIGAPKDVPAPALTPTGPDDAPSRAEGVLRGLSLGFVMLAISLLGAVYFISKAEVVLTSFQVYSGPSARAGEPTVLRMTAHASDGRRDLPVEVKAVRIAGETAPYTLVGDRPTYVKVVLPHTAQKNIDVELEATSNGVHKKLGTALNVQGPAALDERPPFPEHIERHLQAGSEQHVTLLPESQALIRGMSNRVLIRVRDLHGEPIGDADVTVGNKVLFPAGVRPSKRTDPNGLIAIEVRDEGRPMYTFTLDAKKGVAGFQLERRLATHPRQMQLGVDPPVTPSSESPNIRLRTWKPATHAYCELVYGEVVVWARYVTTDRGLAAVRPPPVPSGRYDMQCYDHPASPGSAYASVPVIVSNQEPLAAIIDEVKRHKLPAGAAVDPPEDSDRALAMAYWLAVLRRPLAEPQLVVDTRARDIEAHDEDRKLRQSRILSALGVVVLLFVLWITDGVLKTVIATRERLREFDDRSSPAPNRLIKFRGVILILVLAGAIALTILGVFWLVINVT